MIPIVIDIIQEQCILLIIVSLMDKTTMKQIMGISQEIVNME